MTAYMRAYQGFVKSGMTPADAASLLADLRRETGAELSAGLQAHAKGLYGERPNDTNAVGRKKKVRFGAMRAAADWIVQATTTGHLTTTPHQRNNRSNP